MTQLGSRWRVILGDHDVLTASDAVEMHRCTSVVAAVVVTLAGSVSLPPLGKSTESDFLPLRGG